MIQMCIRKCYSQLILFEFLDIIQRYQNKQHDSQSFKGLPSSFYIGFSVGQVLQFQHCQVESQTNCMMGLNHQEEPCESDSSSRPIRLSSLLIWPSTVQGNRLPIAEFLSSFVMRKRRKPTNKTLTIANKVNYKGSVVLSSNWAASGFPQGTSIHTTDKLIINFPRKVVTTNLHGANLEIPRSIVMISSGRNGVKDATKEPNDPYFASNNCKGVIRVNVSFLISFHHYSQPRRQLFVLKLLLLQMQMQVDWDRIYHPGVR